MREGCRGPERDVSDKNMRELSHGFRGYRVYRVYMFIGFIGFIGFVAMPSPEQISRSTGGGARKTLVLWVGPWDIQFRV